MLLLHRRRPPNAGKWTGVGGKLDAGEDPFGACVREVHEETGLVITVPSMRALLVATVRSTGEVWTIFVFTADKPGGELTASEEGELRWVSPAEIGALPVPADLALLLPRVFDPGSVFAVRLEYEREDDDRPAVMEQVSSV